jgi:hypothetical protein
LICGGYARHLSAVLFVVAPLAFLFLARSTLAAQRLHLSRGWVRAAHYLHGQLLK